MATTCTSSGIIAKGDAVCVTGWDAGPPARPVVARASRTNLGTSKTVYGVAEDAAGGGTVEVLVAGEVAPDDVTSLGAGDSRIIATDINAATAANQCKLIRVDRPNGSEHIVGTCDETGNLSCQPRASVDTSPLQVFNVRSYGARGDGAADDSDAFDATLAAITTAQGGVIYVPAGRYRLTRTLGPLPPNVVVRGESAGDGGTGNGSVLAFETPGLAIRVWDPGPDPSNSPSRIRIEDLSINCSIIRWAPDLTIAVGDLVMPRRNIGLVFQVTASDGATGAVEPQWPTGLDGSVTADGVTYVVAGATGSAIETWRPNMPMTPGRLVRPTAPNGCVYLCIAANYNDESDAGQLIPTTGPAEPAWLTELGDVIADDGDVTWRAYNPEWKAGILVAPGDPVPQLMEVDTATGRHLYVCTAGGTTTAAPIGGWPPGAGAAAAEDGGTVEWLEIGRVADGERVAMWHADWAVTDAAPQTLVFPTRANGRFYKCVDGGTTDADPSNEPLWPLEGTVVDGDCTWEVAGDTLTALRIDLGAFFVLQRLQFPGWPLCIFVDGANATEVANVSFDGEDEGRGVPFPCDASIGLLAGSTAYPDTTNQLAVHDCAFNSAETGVWSHSGVNHHYFDNYFQQGAFSRFARVGGGGVVTSCVFETSSSQDALPGAHSFIWIDGIALALTLRGNFMLAPGVPAVVIQQSVDALTLTGNRWDAGSPTTPQLAGITYVGGSFLSTGNSYFAGAPRFDKVPVGTALVAEPDTVGETLQLFGLNSVNPDASLHLGHGAAQKRPAFAIFQERYRLFEQSVPTDTVPFKQILRHHTPLGGSQEPGTIILLESVGLEADQADVPPVCAFRIARDSVVSATCKVVARSDANDLGVWSVRRTFSRTGGGALTGLGMAQTIEWQDTPGDFAGIAVPTLVVLDDDISIGVELAPLALDVTQWQVELTLRLVSTQPTVASFGIGDSVILDGDLTISGANLFSYGIDQTEVIVTGDGAKVIGESDILGGGGSVDEDGSQIVVPAALLPGVTIGTSFVRVRVNGQTVPASAHGVAGP